MARDVLALLEAAAARTWRPWLLELLFRFELPSRTVPRRLRLRRLLEEAAEEDVLARADCVAARLVEVPLDEFSDGVDDWSVVIGRLLALSNLR